MRDEMRFFNVTKHRLWLLLEEYPDEVAIARVLPQVIDETQCCPVEPEQTALVWVDEEGAVMWKYEELAL